MEAVEVITQKLLHQFPWGEENHKAAVLKHAWTAPKFQHFLELISKETDTVQAYIIILP